MKETSRSRPEDRSAAILRAAVEEFAQEGYAAARMESIAVRAGVTKGLIYFYYKNKQDLFEAVFREGIRERIKGGLLDADPAQSMASHLARGLSNIYHLLEETPFFGQLVRLILLEGHRFPDIHAYYYREVISPLQELLRELLDEGVRRGEWKAEAVPEFPHILVAPCIMHALWGLSFGPYRELDRTRYCREHQRVLLRSLGLGEQAVETALNQAEPKSPGTASGPEINRGGPPPPPSPSRRAFTARAALRRRPASRRSGGE